MTPWPESSYRRAHQLWLELKRQSAYCLSIDFILEWRPPLHVLMTSSAWWDWRVREQGWRCKESSSIIHTVPLAGWVKTPSPHPLIGFLGIGFRFSHHRFSILKRRTSRRWDVDQPANYGGVHLTLLPYTLAASSRNNSSSPTYFDPELHRKLYRFALLPFRHILTKELIVLCPL